MPFPASYPNWVFSLFAFLGFAMACIPFPWHFEAWNTGTCLYMAWTALACLCQFVNSIVWNRNAINWAPVWCDIFPPAAKITVGTAVAIPAASLCINRRLYHIASVRAVTVTKAEKRRQIMVDLAIGLGLPILEMILQYIPQGHRFNIYEDVGCWPFTYDTWVAYLLVSAPPICIGLVSAVYAVLSIRAFNQSRAQSKEMLSGYSNLTSSRYFRLMALAGCDVLCTVPLGIYATYLNAADGAISPWISWQNTHAGFSRVDQIPAIIWRSNPVTESALEMSRWLCVVCAVLFFGFFGFADEARKHYRSAISSVAKRVGVSTGSFGGSTGIISSSEFSRGGVGSHPGSLPSFGREKLDRKSSYDASFSDTSSLKDAGVVPPSPLDEKKNLSITNVFGGKKKFNEEVFKPTFQYDNLVLPDIGGTLADHSTDEISPVPSSGSSSASSISIPEPAVTRSEARGADTASLRSLPPYVISEEPRRNPHDMV
ncbi:STE3-domain-containing protein [Macrolepiota fuliginosa MF-IS2]|uniref:STE3-domain-containing protein n=1 Tax=Macrolepiota fuliginosa MF-IS2 TaxID=1400762 RepID=A0A9P5XCN9_9AGAR|nr:STE3-domain-containing protein [Macrolepiota fuliginosa MF-IS2]